MIDVIKQKFREEVTDFHAYKKLEKQAYDTNDRFVALWIGKIAREEYTHARWMRHYLKEHGAFSAECEDMWKSVIDEMEK